MLSKPFVCFGIVVYKVFPHYPTDPTKPLFTIWSSGFLGTILFSPIFVVNNRLNSS